MVLGMGREDGLGLDDVVLLGLVLVLVASTVVVTQIGADLMDRNGGGEADAQEDATPEPGDGSDGNAGDEDSVGADTPVEREEEGEPDEVTPSPTPTETTTPSPTPTERATPTPEDPVIDPPGRYDTDGR